MYYVFLYEIFQRADIVQKVTEVAKKSKFGSVSIRFPTRKNPTTSKSVGNLNVPAGSSRSSSARTSQGMPSMSTVYSFLE